MIYCQPIKEAGKAANPTWFWHGNYREWIPNVTDPIRCRLAYHAKDRESEYLDTFIKERTDTARNAYQLERTPAHVEPVLPQAWTLRDRSGTQGVQKRAPATRRQGESILEVTSRAIAARLKEDEVERARAELAIQAAERPVERVSATMATEWRKKVKAAQPRGYEPYGPKGTCIFTSLPAENVDHTPSLAYVEAHGGSSYGGRKMLVASYASANAHKADFGSECLWQCAERIAYRAHVAQKDPYKASAIINGVRDTWPRTDYPCPCIRCQSVDSETRRAQIARDLITTHPVTRDRGK